MQIISQAECVFLGIKENVGKEDRKFYEVSLEQNDSVCSISTSAEVYNMINSAENKISKYKACIFTFIFDTRFNNMRVVKIVGK